MPVLEAGAIRYFDCRELSKSVRRLVRQRQWRFARPVDPRIVRSALGEPHFATPDVLHRLEFLEIESRYGAPQRFELDAVPFSCDDEAVANNDVVLVSAALLGDTPMNEAIADALGPLRKLVVVALALEAGPRRHTQQAGRTASSVISSVAEWPAPSPYDASALATMMPAMPLRSALLLCRANPANWSGTSGFN